MSEPLVVTRNLILDRLLALGAGLTFPTIAGAQAINIATRKWRDISTFNPHEFPVLVQIDPQEVMTPTKLGMRNRTVMEVKWLFFFMVDDQDQTQSGSVYLNDLLDAVERRFYGDGPDARQTLGGAVEHCYLGEEILKASGDDTGKGILAVTIHIVRP